MPGDIDIACGNLYTIFVSEQKGVIVTFGRVVCDDGHFQSEISATATGVSSGMKSGSVEAYTFTFPLMRGKAIFPLNDTVPYVVFFAHNGYMWSCAAARREQHCQRKQVQQILVHNS